MFQVSSLSFFYAQNFFSKVFLHLRFLYILKSSLWICFCALNFFTLKVFSMRFLYIFYFFTLQVSLCSFFNFLSSTLALFFLCVLNCCAQPFISMILFLPWNLLTYHSFDAIHPCCFTNVGVVDSCVCWRQNYNNWRIGGKLLATWEQKYGVQCIKECKHLASILAKFAISNYCWVKRLRIGSRLWTPRGIQIS